MSGGAISTIFTSFSDMPSLASILRRKRKSTAKRLGMAICLPARSWNFLIGRVSAHHDDRARPVTDGDGLDRDVLRCEIHHQRGQHVGGVGLPEMSDSLISGEPLYRLYSKFAPAEALSRLRATQAMGSVRLQVTGNPATVSVWSRSRERKLLRSSVQLTLTGIRTPVPWLRTTCPDP